MLPTLADMNELLPSGLVFLRTVDSFTEGVKDPARALADELGLLTTTAGSLIAAAKNWREISTELERRVDKLSIQQLQIISQAMNKTTDPEGVREALVAYATRPTDARREPTADELKRYAQTVVAGNKPKKPRCSLLFSRHEDATGTRYAQLALPSAHMECFEALVRKWWPGDKEKEKSPALKNAIGLQRLLNDTSGTDGDGRWDETKDKLVQGLAGGYLPVVGDWNGDGIDNIGVFADGTWILDSDGDYRYDKTLHHGQKGDKPVTGDWDGDGVDDIGVYRDTTSGDSSDSDSSIHAQTDGDPSNSYVMND